MLSRVAGLLVPLLGRLDVTTDSAGGPAAGSIVIANHTSLGDPAIVLAALRRLGTEPVVLAAAGLWRIPVLRRVLTREGHVPVHRHDPRAAQAVRDARAALAAGRTVLIYPEGGLPAGSPAEEAPPRTFHPGLYHLAHTTGAPVVPLGQAGAPALVSGPPLEQAARLLTAPLRRPRLCVHVGEPLHLGPGKAEALEAARTALTGAWRVAARRLDARSRPVAR